MAAPTMTFQQKHQLATQYQPTHIHTHTTNNTPVQSSIYNTQHKIKESNFQLLFKSISNESLRLQTAQNQSDIISDFSSYKTPTLDYDTITHNSIVQHNNKPRFLLPNDYRANLQWPQPKLTDILNNTLERDNAAVAEAIRRNDLGLGPAGFQQQSRSLESANLHKITGEQPMQPKSVHTRPKHNSEFNTLFHKDESVLKQTELPSMTITRSALKEVHETEYDVNQRNIRALYHPQHSILRQTELPANVITRDIVQ